jgi:hypothetical protein
VKRIIVAAGLGVAGLAFGQTAVSIVERTSGNVQSRSLITTDANGRRIPIENTEERVVSDSGGLRVVERIIRRYDHNGIPGPPEVQRIETAKQADGGVKTTTTVSRGDVNGHTLLAERTTAMTIGAPGNTSTSVKVERLTANASFDVVEVREETTRTTGPGKTNSTSVTQRPDPNGRLTAVARRTVERTETPAGVVENAAEFDTSATGQMQLARQVVTRTANAADGTIVSEVDTFETSGPGRVGPAEGPPQLTKRQVIENKPTPTGSVQTISSAFPSPNDPGKVGPLRFGEQTVCTGDCGKSATKK